MGNRMATYEDLNAAAARCKARGVSTLIDEIWEAAMREELTVMGLTTQTQAEVDAAADARLAKGEAQLHAARLAARDGNERNGHVERVITVGDKCAAIYEQDGAWCVDDGDGNSVAQGLRDEDHAEQVARRHLAR